MKLINGLSMLMKIYNHLRYYVRATFITHLYKMHNNLSKKNFIENGLKLQKTHNILSLNEILKQNDIHLNITDDEIDSIDTIYLSSKYPFGSVLPDFEPDKEICLECIDIASRVQEDIKKYLKKR